MPLPHPVQPGRNPLLDVARLLAALAVVGYHYTAYGPANGLTGGSAFPGLEPLFRYGYLGVPFFFLISGYVILQSAQRCTALQFAGLRALRLYPAYWLAVPIAAIAAHAVPAIDPPSLQTLAINLTMVQGYLATPHVDGVYWTLTVELMFYAWVFGLLLVGRLDWLPVLAVALLAAATVHHSLGVPRAIYLLTQPDWSPYFVAGCTLYCWQTRIHRRVSAALWCWALMLCLWQATAAAAHMSSLLDATVSTTASGVLTGLAFVGFVAVVQSGRHVAVPLAGLAGALSYPLYLLHQNVGYAVFSRWGSSVDDTLLGVLLLAALLVVCAGIALLFEAPLRRALRPLVLSPTGPWFWTRDDQPQGVRARRSAADLRRTGTSGAWRH
ncbi:MAG: acyltransferase [Pseudomonadota bacterium]